MVPVEPTNSGSCPDRRGVGGLGFRGLGFRGLGFRISSALGLGV